MSDNAEAAAALADLLRLAGIDPVPADLRGADPVFPTPYKVGSAGAAALAAVGTAASRLWYLKTNRIQNVRIDVRAAAAAMRSARYLRIDGQAPKDPWDAFSGYYPVKDGRWISIHCNFANHREAAMKVLGNPADRAAAEAASAKWDGLALEDAIHAAKGCAGLARPKEEWMKHPHSAAVAAQPLLVIEKIGESKAEPLPTGNRPLSGVRVLDLTRVLAGPTCAKSLAEHGADVLKITAAHLPDSGMADLDTGIGKLSARLDLRNATETDALRGLARESDVFVESYRPGALAARGFSPEALARLRPGIVCASLSAWGPTGPWRERRGFDSIVQAVSGIAQASGDSAKPRLLPVSAIDYVTGYLMAFGVCVALGRRAREGGSWLVRIALARVGKWIVDRGTLPETAYRGLPNDLPEAELNALYAEMDAPDGSLRYLKPVLSLSETPPYFSRPPVPLGYHPPRWTSS